MDKVIKWAGTMTWKGIKPVIHLSNRIYRRGLRLTKKEMKPYEQRIQRSDRLPKWNIIIEPLSG